MKLPDLKLPDFSSLVTPPPIIPNLDFKTPRIVSAIDNIQNIGLSTEKNLWEKIKKY